MQETIQRRLKGLVVFAEGGIGLDWIGKSGCGVVEKNEVKDLVLCCDVM